MSEPILVDRHQPIVIPDPELLLPDERLPKGRVLLAQSSFIGGEYSSLASLIEKRKRAEERLNAGVTDWQRDIAPPTFVVFSVRNDATGERLFVFGDIPDMDTLLKSGRVVTEDLSALRRLRRRIEHGLERGWLYGQWFSRTKPDGEWGVMHKSYVQSPMSDSEFESFRAKGWVTGDEGTPT